MTYRTRTYVFIMMVLVAIMAWACSEYSAQMAEYKATSIDFTCQPGGVYTTQECP